MCEEKPFDLSELLADSLSLQASSASQTRVMYPTSNLSPYFRMLRQEPLELLGENAFGQPKKVPEDVVGTPIQEFYRGVNVMITGGTGFIGKVLTEKLIRSIPHIGHVYLLIRAKRGKNCQERFEQLLEDKLFSRMRVEVPHYMTKITALEGDVSETDLGLSDADHQLLLERVHVVFHCAADVRFIEPLRVAIASNVLGSQRVLNLAKDMKHLKSYVHVSTAFSQCVKRVIEETVPKMSITYKEILEYVESSSDEDLRKEPLRIMQGWPNTYTFSKAVCEDMIQEEAADLPVCIFRPSVVSPTYKEPVRGWTDNVYGPVGLMLAAAHGVVHCFKINTDAFYPDNVPVDYTVSCMISAAWRTATHRAKDAVPVYNYTNFANRISWNIVIRCGYEIVKAWPFSQAIWSFSILTTASDLVDDMANTFLHKIPGKILDTVAVMSGRKPRLIKIYDKLSTVKKPIKYFLHKTWEFKTDNVTDLWKSLTKEDKEEFHFDTSDIDPFKHLIIGMLGMRYYYLKESMDSIASAKRKSKWLYCAHCCLQLVCGYAALKLSVYVAHALPI